MKKLCVYHHNCADGFAAALAVRTGLGEENVEFYKGVHYGTPPDVTGRDVVMVDFCYKKPVMLDLAREANSILILDHHKSAEEDLRDLPSNVECIFDMERSGAVMAWEHFLPEHDLPQLFEHIQDRDLWKLDLQDTEYIQSAIFSHEYDFEVWAKLLTTPIEDLVRDGRVLTRKHLKDINEFIEGTAHHIIIEGHLVPALNAPYFWSSEAGDILGKDEEFAVCYWKTKEYIVYSLRSEKDKGIDVSEIASLFGGGGHKHAAGFSIPLDSEIFEVIREY